MACKLPTDTAISSGVQTLGLAGRAAPVSSSFPGRMDWSTDAPKADRTDGWIVQFNGTTDPGKAKVYAQCVPDLTVPVVLTFSQN